MPRLPLKPVTSPVFGSVSQQQQTLKHLSKKQFYKSTLFLFSYTQLNSLSQIPQKKTERKLSQVATAVLHSSSADLMNLVVLFCDRKQIITRENFLHDSGEESRKKLLPERENSDAIRKNFCNFEHFCAVKKNKRFKQFFLVINAR